MEINKEEFKSWMTALRSGNFKQTRGGLHDITGYCCLGVACAVMIPRDRLQLDSMGLFIMGDFPEAQPNAPEWLKEINSDFAKRYGREISKLNDYNKFSFSVIADIVEHTYFPNGYQ